MRAPILALALALSLAAAGPAAAASFPCAKAETPDERAVCDTRALNDLDVEMGVRFDILKDLLQQRLHRRHGQVIRVDQSQRPVRAHGLAGQAVNAPILLVLQACRPPALHAEVRRRRPLMHLALPLG